MVYLLLLLILLTGCSSDLGSGGATDTGNAFISGTLVDTQYNEVAQREIVIALDDADPLTNDTLNFVRCTTNSDGYFESPMLEVGDYILYNRKRGDGILHRVVIETDTEKSVGELHLKNTGSLLVTSFQFEDSLPEALIIPGTPISIHKNDENQFILDSIPSALIPAIQARYSDGSKTEIVANKELKEGEHTVLAGDIKVLFLVEGDTSILSQSVINERNLLLSYGFQTVTKEFSTITPSIIELSEYDLIYGCNELLWDSNKESWCSLSIPIATSSVFGYEVLAMTDSVDGSHGTRLESTLLTDLTGFHPAFVGTGWNSSKIVPPVESGESTWGKPTSGATIFLKGNASQAEKYLFVYRKDTEMYHSTTAPAGRIAIFLGQSKVNSSAMTQSMIQRAIFWGMDKL